MMTRNTQQYDDDDGRVICDMDVDGMRWHDRRVRNETRTARKASVMASAHGEQLTRSESRRYTYYAVLSGLFVVLIFSVVWIVFVWFCINVWFR